MNTAPTFEPTFYSIYALLQLPLSIASTLFNSDRFRNSIHS